MDFQLQFTDGSIQTIRARGVALDGEYLLFFNHWASEGGIPKATKVPVAGVETVTTAATPTGAWS
jgi:hypothetical protein